MAATKTKAKGHISARDPLEGMRHPERPHAGTSCSFSVTPEGRSRGQQSPGEVRRAESHGRPHSRQEGWASLSLPHPHHSPHPPHTETHAPAESPDLFTVSSSRYGPLYLKYGKGQGFANLAANLNHKESSVKSRGWSLISVKSESRGRGGEAGVNIFY